MYRKSLCIIGCGAIGQSVIKFFDKEDSPVSVVLIYDQDVRKVESFVRTLAAQRPKIAKSFEDVLKEKYDIVLEAASPEAVREYVFDLVKVTRNLVIMSVSAFSDFNLLQKVVEECRKYECRLHIPSGAIGGVDLLKAHAIAGIERIEITTKKPPRALGLEVQEERVVYEGDVLEALSKYPRNVNVYMTVLLSIGLDVSKVRCRIVADPRVQTNIHEIHVKSSIGSATIRVENIPSELNPRTSKLAIYSAIRKILEICQEEISIGT